MKIIFKIAKAELKTLFYSPVGWLLLIVFFLTVSINFVPGLINFAKTQEIERANNPNWIGFLTGMPLSIACISGGIFTMTKYLYLFIPLLTMGTISRELQSGSINLLSTSPVKVREMVLGKFLGIFVYSIVLLGSILLLIITSGLTVEKVQFTWLITIWAGFILLSSAYIAIGVFISTLTQYQLIAGLVTYLCLFLLNHSNELWQHHDFIRDITYYLCINDRVNLLFAGLVTSRDVLYFFLIVILFLGLAILKLKSRFESMKVSHSIMVYTGWMGVILAIGYVSSRPGNVAYQDVTREQLRTADSSAIAALKELDGSKVTVTLYANLLGNSFVHGMPSRRNKYIWSFWQRYFRFYPNIDFKYVYYYDRTMEDSLLYSSLEGGKTKWELARTQAKLNKLPFKQLKSPAEIHELVDFQDEPMNLIMELEYKDKKEFLRTFAGSPPWPDDPHVAAVFRKLAGETSPKVRFVTGHHERSPYRTGSREYGNHTNNKLQRNALVNHQVDLDTLSVNHTMLSPLADVLVVADPKSELSTAELDNISQYLEEGGNALILGEPGKQQMLNPLLAKLGVKLEDGILVLPRKHALAHSFNGILTKVGNQLAKEQAMQVNQYFGKGSAAANFTGTTIISYSDTSKFQIEPIITIKGAQKQWMELGMYVSDSAAPTFDPFEGDYARDEYVVGVKLTRNGQNKQQRIIVTADADFLSTSGKNGGTIGLGLYSWLLDNEYPKYSKIKIPIDIHLKISPRESKMIWYVFVYAIPGLLLMVGSLIIIRRMRR